MSVAMTQPIQEVMIELQPPHGLAAQDTAAWASHFAAPGVTFQEYGMPIPMEGGTIIVRASVDSLENAMALEGRPEVVKVWKDTPIAPYGADGVEPEPFDAAPTDDDVEIVDPLSGDSTYDSPSVPQVAEPGSEDLALDEGDDSVDESNLGF